MKTDMVIAAYIYYDEKVLLIHHKKTGLWLPVGGHMDQNEVPDDAVHREVKEEVNLEVEIVNTDPMRASGAVRRVLAPPLCVNVHNVGSHDHCCFFYVCKAKDLDNFKINKDEILDYRWHTKEDLLKEYINSDVREIALKGFELLKENNM
jgi:8-oxo-dGTP pyrophosphatase MutT (NUDIX family)